MSGADVDGISGPEPDGASESEVGRLPGPDGTLGTEFVGRTGPGPIGMAELSTGGS